eukprot:313618_1
MPYDKYENQCNNNNNNNNNNRKHTHTHTRTGSSHSYNDSYIYNDINRPNLYNQVASNTITTNNNNNNNMSNSRYLDDNAKYYMVSNGDNIDDIIDSSPHIQGHNNNDLNDDEYFKLMEKKK